MRARSNGKHPGGRPSLYKPSYCQKLLAFFSVEPVEEFEEHHTNAKGETWTVLKQRPTRPPFFSAFARSIGVTHDAIENWTKKYPEFGVAVKEAKRLQEEHFVECGYKGLSNPAVTIFLLKNNHGYRDHDALPPLAPLPLPKFVFYIGTSTTPKVIDSADLVAQARSALEPPEISTNGGETPGDAG